jgi:hypothetical protein
MRETGSVDREDQGALGRVELVADALRQHLEAPSPESTGLLARLVDQVAKDASSGDADAVLCRVALSAALESGVSSSRDTSAINVNDSMRALHYFLELAKALITPGSVGLEQLLLAFAVPLAWLKLNPLPEEQSKVIQVGARLASLSEDAAAASGLVLARQPNWPAEAVGEVIACALEIEAAQQDLHERGDLEREAALLASDPDMRPMTSERLKRALSSMEAARRKPSWGPPGHEEISNAFVREAQIAEELLAHGDYAGAELAASRLSHAPAQVRLVGENLTVLARLHRGLLDDEPSARHEIERLTRLVRLPEFASLEDRSSTASPESALREIASHALALNTPAGARTAARAAEAIAGSRILRVQLTGHREMFLDLSRAIAQTRARLDAEDWVAAAETDGREVVHVTDLYLEPRAATLALTHLRPARGEASGYTAGLSGSALRILNRLIVNPPAAEKLDEIDHRILTNAIFGKMDIVEPVLIIPSPRLWTLPMEDLLPGSTVALSYQTWQRMPPLSQKSDRRLKVCFVGDDMLPGAVAEREVLRRHAAAGALDLVEATSLHDAAEILGNDETVDVLALALHGRGEGFNYAFEHDGKRLPVHELVGWRLPRIVVAATCSSGRTGTRLNFSTVLAGSVAALVVGLWDLDDAAVGTLLGGFYSGLAETRSITAAWARLPGHGSGWGLRLLTNYGGSVLAQEV